MANKHVHWDEQKQLVIQVIKGHQTSSDAKEATAEYEEVLAERQSAKVLVVFERGAKLSKGAIDEYSRMGKDFDAMRIAVVTKSGPLRRTALSILASGGYAQEVKIFTKQSAAISWLQKGGAIGLSSYTGALIIFSLLILAVVLATISLNRVLYEDEEQVFQNEIAQVMAQADVFIHEYEATLFSVRAFFEASEFVSRQEWITFTESLLGNNNLESVEAVGFIRRIAEEDLESHVETIRSEEVFSQEFRNDYQIFPEGTYEEYYVADYIAPWNESNSAYGFNIYSNLSRRAAVNEAVEGNKIVVTEPTELVGDGDGMGFLLILPVYGNDLPTTTIAQRQENSIGVITLVFSAEKFLSTVTERLYKPETLILEAYDVSEDKACNLQGGLCVSVEEMNEKLTSRFQQTEEIFIGERSWAFLFQANQLRSEAFWSRSDIIVGIIGSILATLVGLLFLSAGKTRENAEKRAEELVKDYTEISKRLRLATESAKMGVWDWDVVNNDLTWDEQMYAVYGVDPSNFTGAFDAWQNGLHPDDKEDATKEVELALEGKKKFDTIFRVIWADQSIHYIRAFGTVNRDIEGNAIRMTGLNWDVTHEMEVDKAKSEFVSLASHQLRTPLSSINWYTEMLLAGDAGRITKKQKEFLGEIDASSQRMVELVNALLNVSRLELGTFMVQPEPTDVGKLANQVVKEIQPSIKMRKQKLKKSIDKTLKKVDVDPKLMNIIFQNLLTNAVKYTLEGGEIELDVKRDEGTIQIRVSDNGLGIPESQKGKIFTKLFRADNVRELDTEGTGLGLYIVKSILDETGGAITFESKQGEGTTFYVTIPLSGMIHREGTRELS